MVVLLQHHLPMEVVPTQRVCPQLRQLGRMPSISKEITMHEGLKAMVASWRGLKLDIIRMVEFHLVQPMKLKCAGSKRPILHVRRLTLMDARASK